MKRKGGKLKKIRTKLIITLSILLSLVVLAFIYLELVVNPLILNIARAQIDSIATTAVSDAIFNVVNKSDLDYSDLVNVSYDNNNNITAISSNMEKVNYLAREISTQAQILLDKMWGTGVKVALGAFTGLEIFTQVGPDVTLRMMPIGSVITTFDSEFHSAGINQTKHSLYIDVNTSISVILPTSTQTLDFITSALVYESIIVGKVPSVYLQGTKFLKSEG